MRSESRRGEQHQRGKREGPDFDPWGRTPFTHPGVSFTNPLGTLKANQVESLV